MELLAQYPVREADIIPHVGRSVCGLTIDGDPFFGAIDRCENGYLYMRPLPASGAAIQNIKRRLAEQPEMQKRTIKAKTSAWWGFGPWGWGWPLWALASLWFLPFLWW